MKEIKTLIKSKFVYLWASQIFSQITINVMNFLLLLKLFSVTESTIATSMLWIAYALPAVIFGPIAAAVIDLHNLKKVLKVTNLLQALTIFVYAVAHERLLFLSYGIVMTYSFLNQFYLPAEAASVPTLVKKKQLAKANGLFFLTQQVALVIGFGSAGFLYQFLGFKYSLFICSASVFVAFLSVNFLPDMKPKTKLGSNLENALIKFFARIYEGYKFIKGNQNILLPFLTLIALQVLLAVVVVNVPIISRDILKVSQTFTGISLIAPVGLGTVIGALFIPALLRKGWRKIKVIKYSLAIMIFSLFSIALYLPDLNNIPRLVLGSVFIVLIGLSFIGIYIPSQTFLQETTPGGLRGRVFGNFWFLATVATLFPVILGGTITELFGIRHLIFIIGFVLLFGLIVIKKRETGYV